MQPSHAWVGGSAQRWVLSWFPATKTECTCCFSSICCRNRNKMWRDGPGCPNTWIWARLGSQFLTFVLSNLVLQKQGELSTLYQCGQQSLKYLLSGPFQIKKEKFANYCRRKECRVNWLDESFTYQLSWEILAQRRLSKNISGMQTLQRMSTAGVGFRVRQASLGEPELWWAAESWLSAVLTHSWTLLIVQQPDSFSRKVWILGYLWNIWFLKFSY